MPIMMGIICTTWGLFKRSVGELSLHVSDVKRGFMCMVCSVIYKLLYKNNLCKIIDTITGMRFAHTSVAHRLVVLV